MKNEEIIKYFNIKFTAIDDKFKDQKELLEAKITYSDAKTELLIGDTHTKLDEIVEQNKVRNGKIEVLEKKVEERELFCGFTQGNKKTVIEKKREKLSNSFKIVMALIGITGLVFTVNKAWPSKPVKEIIMMKQINDSTVVVSPATKIRAAEPYQIDTLSILYFDIK
jgi:hypothetical protein